MQFIDYGNTEVKSHGDVLDIPPRFCAAPPLAHCFTLYGIDIVHDDMSTLGYEQVCTSVHYCIFAVHADVIVDSGQVIFSIYLYLYFRVLDFTVHARPL